MAELSTLARPYAKAAFDFASESGQTNEWAEYLAFSADLLKDKSFASYLALPTVTPSDQLDAIVKVSNNSFPVEYTNFLAQLVENDRLPMLPALFNEYQRIKAASEQETKAIIETAYELSAAEQSLLSDALQKRFGNTVTIETKINPELIAGVIIRVGDQVIDDSALGKLKQLKTKLTA